MAQQSSPVDVLYSTISAALSNLKKTYIDAQDNNTNVILDIKLTAMISLINDVSNFIKETYDNLPKEETKGTE